MLRQIDTFGQGVSLNFRGTEKYKTNIGGFCSLVMYIILIPYILTKFLILVNRSDPTTTFNEVYHNITSLGEVTGSEIHYDFAFALLNAFGEDLSGEVDETYLIPVVSQMTQDVASVEYFTLGSEFDLIDCTN